MQFLSLKNLATESPGVPPLLRREQPEELTSGQIGTSAFAALLQRPEQELSRGHTVPPAELDSAPPELRRPVSNVDHIPDLAAGGTGNTEAKSDALPIALRVYFDKTLNAAQAQPAQPVHTPDSGFGRGMAASVSGLEPTPRPASLAEHAALAPEMLWTQSARQETELQQSQLHSSGAGLKANAEAMEVWAAAELETPAGATAPETESGLPSIPETGGGAKFAAGYGNANGSGSGSGLARGPAFFILRKSASEKVPQKAKARSAARANAAGRAGRSDGLSPSLKPPDTTPVMVRPPQEAPPLIATRQAVAAPQPNLIPLKLQHLQTIRELAQKIQERAKLLHRGGETSLEIRLSPPRLGLLRVQMAVQGETMCIHFAAQRDEAIPALQEARAELCRLMSDQGYHLTRCDIEVQAFPDRWPDAHQLYTADRQRDRATVRENPSNSGADQIEAEAEDHHPLDLGYNTLDLVA